MAEDLAQEQARLEGEIAFLSQSLSRAEARLDVARASPPKPRGLGAGIAVGAAFAALFLFVCFYMAMSAIFRMD